MKIIFMAGFIVLVSVVRIHAAPYVVESFSYPIGSINGQNGGAGFAGAWVSSTGEQIVSGNLQFPFGAGQTGTGGQLEISGATVSRAVSWQNVSLALNATNYFSVLVNKGGSSAASSENLIFWIKPASATIAGFEITSDEKVKLNDRAGSVVSTETVDLNTTYLMLLKIVTSSSASDEVYLTWFRSDERVPKNEADVVWKLSRSFVNSYPGAAASVEFTVGSAISATVDEIRVGGAYSDIALPPQLRLFLIH